MRRKKNALRILLIRIVSMPTIGVVSSPLIPTVSVSLTSAIGPPPNIGRGEAIE